MITIAVTEPTKGKRVTRFTNHVARKNLPARILNVLDQFIGAMEKMIAVIIRMKLGVVKPTRHAQLDSLGVTMENVLIISWFAIKFQTAQMIVMNRCIVMWMNARKLKFISAIINAWIL